MGKSILATNLAASPEGLCIEVQLKSGDEVFITSAYSYEDILAFLQEHMHAEAAVHLAHKIWENEGIVLNL